MHKHNTSSATAASFHYTLRLFLLCTLPSAVMKLFIIKIIPFRTMKGQIGSIVNDWKKLSVSVARCHVRAFHPVSFGKRSVRINKRLYVYVCLVRNCLYIVDIVCLRDSYLRKHKNDNVIKGFRVRLDLFVCVCCSKFSLLMWMVVSLSTTQ